MILLLSALNQLQTTSRDPLNFPTSIFKYGLSDCIILFCSVMTRKQDCFKTILLFLIARQRRQILPQSPENHGRDRFPSSSCLRPGFHEPLLFISAVAVWAAGGESVLPHKVSRAARLAHGVVQTAQRGSEVI